MTEKKCKLADYDVYWNVSVMRPCYFYTVQDPGKSEWGHYTQVVWAKTTKVGCGRSLFHSTESGYPVRMEFLVCNYGPGGNFNGRVVYKSGIPASECRSAVPSKKYPGLCEISKEEEDVQLIINQRHKKKKSSFIWRKKISVGAPGLGPIKTFTVDQTASGKTNYSIMTGSHVAKDYNTFLGMFMDGHGKIAAKNVLNTLGIPYKTTISENDNPNVPIIVAELPSPADIVETLQSKKQFRKFQRKAKFLKKLLGSDRSVNPLVPQVNSLQTNNYAQISGSNLPYVGAFNKSPFNSNHPISVPNVFNNPATAQPQLIQNVYTNPSISQPQMISNVFNSPPLAVTISHPPLVANIFNKPAIMSTSPPQYNTNHFNSEPYPKPNVIANIFKNPLSTFQPQQVSNNFNSPAKWPPPQPKLIPNVFNNPSVLSSPQTQLSASTFSFSHGNTLYPYTFSNMYQNTPLQPKVISNIFQSTVTPSFNQPQTVTNIFKTSRPQILPNIFQSVPTQDNFQPRLNTNVYNNPQASNPQTITNIFNNPNSLLSKHLQPAENAFVKPVVPSVSQPQVIHNIFEKVNANNQGQQLVPNIFGNGMTSLGSQPLLVTNIFRNPQPQLFNSYSMNAAPAPDLSDSENTSENAGLLSSISSTPHSNVLSKPSSNIFSKPFSKPFSRPMKKYTKDNISTYLSSGDPTIIFTTTSSGHETLTPFTQRTVVENISLCPQNVLENIKNNNPKEICKSKVVGNTTVIECSSRSEQSSVNRVSYYNKNKGNLTSDITSISKMMTNTTTNLTRVPSGLLNITSVLKVDINSTIKLPVIAIGHQSTRSNFTKTSNAEQMSMDNIMSDSYSGKNIITNATVISQSNSTITRNITSFLIERAFIQSYEMNVTRFENKIHKSLIKCDDRKQSNVYATTENIKNDDKTQASLPSNVSVNIILPTSNIKPKDERTIGNFNTTETTKDNLVKHRSYDGLTLNDTGRLTTNDFDVNYYNPEDIIATSFRREPSFSQNTLPTSVKDKLENDTTPIYKNMNESFYDRELLDNASKLLQNFHNELYIFATPLQLMSSHASLKHTNKNISRLLVNNNKVYKEKPHLPKRQKVKKFSHSISSHKGNIRPRISPNLESDDLPYSNRTHLINHATKRQGKREKNYKISQEKLIKEEKVSRRESDRKHFVTDNVPIKVKDLGSKFRFTSTNSTGKDKGNISQQNLMRHKPRLGKDTKMRRSFYASHDKDSSHKDLSSLIPLDLPIGPIEAENDKEKSIGHHEQHSNMLTMLNKENGSFPNDEPEERNLSQATKLPILTTHGILSYISLKSDTEEPEAEQIPCDSNTSCNGYKKRHSHDLNDSYLSHKTQSSILPTDCKNNYTSETDSYGSNELNTMVSKLEKKFKQNDSHALPCWKNLFYITPVDSALNSRQNLQPNKRRHNESCPCEQENEFLNYKRVKNDHRDMLSKSDSNLKFTKDHYLKKRSVNIENVNNQSDFEKSQSRHELFDVKQNLGNFETYVNLTKGYKEDSFTVAKYVPEHTTLWKDIVLDGLDLLNFLNNTTPTILNNKSKVLITKKQITPEFYISSNNLGLVLSHILAISNKNTSSSNFNKMKDRVDDHITIVNENDSSVRLVYPNGHYIHILDESEKENISNSNSENVSNDSNLEKSQLRPEIFDAKWNIGTFETNLNLTKGDKEDRFIIAKDVPEQRTLWKYENLDEDNIMNYPNKSTPVVLDDKSKFLITKEEIAPEFKSSNSGRVSSRMLPIPLKNSFSSNFNPWKYWDKDRIVIVHENDSSVRVVYPNGRSIHILDEDENENTSFAIVQQTVTPISFTPNKLKISKPVSDGNHIVHKINRGSFSYGMVPQGMDPLGENSPNLFAMSKKDRIAQLLKFGSHSQSETRMKYSRPVRTKPLKEKPKINFNRPILRNVPLTLHKNWDNFPQEMKIDNDETKKTLINETIKSVNDSNIRIKPINKKLTNNDNDEQPINQRGRRGWKVKKYTTQTKILPDALSTVSLRVQNVDVFMNRSKLKPVKSLENVFETLQENETPSETDKENKIILKQNIEDFEKDNTTKIVENKTRQFYIPQTNINTPISDSINSTITNKRYKVTNIHHSIEDTDKIPAISIVEMNSPKEIENILLLNPNVGEQNYMKQMIENNDSRQYIANLLKNQSTTQDLINYYINYNRTITFPGYNLNNASEDNVNISTHPQSVSKINYVAMNNISCQSPKIYVNNNTMCGNRTLNDDKDYLVIYHPTKNTSPLSTGLLETIEPDSLVGADGNRDQIEPMKDNTSHDSDTKTTFKKSFGMNDKIFFGKSSSKHIDGSSNISSISNIGDSVDNKYLYGETRNIQVNNDKLSIFEVNANDHESHGNNSLSDSKIYSDNRHRSNTNLLVKRNRTKSQSEIALKSNSSIRSNETNNTINKQGNKYKHNDVNHNNETTIRNENKNNNSNQIIETAEIREFKNGNNSYLENKTLNATTKHEQLFLNRNVNLKDNYQSEQDTNEDNTNENITEFTNMYSNEILTQIYTNKPLIKHSKNKNKTRRTITGKIKIDKPTSQASSLKYSFKSAQTTSNYSINGSSHHYKNDDDIKLHKNSETIRKNLSGDNIVGFSNKITTDNSSSLSKRTTNPIKSNTLTNEINKTLNINHITNFLGNNKISVGNKNQSTLLHITLPDKHIKSDLVDESKHSLEKSNTTPTNINLSNSDGLETSKKSHEIHHTINTYQGHTNIVNHESTIEKYSSYETKRTNSSSLFMSNSKNLHTNSKVKINKFKTSEMMDRNKIPINSIRTTINDLNISNINSSNRLFNQSTHLLIEKRHPIDTINTYKFEIVRGLKTDNTTIHKVLNSLYFPTNTNQTNKMLIVSPTLKAFRSNNKNTRIGHLMTWEEKGDPAQIERDLKTSGTSLLNISQQNKVPNYKVTNINETSKPIVKTNLTVITKIPQKVIKENEPHTSFHMGENLINIISQNLQTPTLKILDSNKIILGNFSNDNRKSILTKGKSTQVTYTMQSNETKDSINHENESESTVWTTHKESRSTDDKYINKINNETHKLIENKLKQSATSDTKNITDENRILEETEKRLITNSNEIKEERNVMSNFETSTNERSTVKRPLRRKRKKQYLMIKEPDFKNVPAEEVVVQLLKL